MPDRAVVERGPWYGWHTCGNCGKLQTVRCQDCGEPLPEHEEPDRAVMAISEDRQAIVFLTASSWWAGHYLNGYGDVGERAFIVNDTGQSADEVLAEFLREREK